MRRLALGLVALLVVAAPAGADIVDRKQSVDSRIGALQARVAAAQEKEAALRQEIDDVSGRIRGLEQQVGDVSSRLAPLEHELAAARGQAQPAERALPGAERPAGIPAGGVPDRARPAQPPPGRSVRIGHARRALRPALVEQLLGLPRRRSTTSSWSPRGTGRSQTRCARPGTRWRSRWPTRSAARRDMLRQAKIFAVRVHQARVLRDQLLANQGALLDAQSSKKADLASLSAQEQADAGEIDSLQQVSAELAAKIQAAQSHSTVQHTGSGQLSWPVSAPITSPFGWRWGRMHEGVDLGAAYGTPIAAAAAGTVIYAGWLGGYGNLTVIDHGGGLATAYGHQSQDRRLGRPTGRPGRDHRLRRLHRPLDRAAPALRGARQRPGRRPARLPITGEPMVPPLAPSCARSLRSHHDLRHRSGVVPRPPGRARRRICPRTSA